MRKKNNNVAWYSQNVNPLFQWKNELTAKRLVVKQPHENSFNLLSTADKLENINHAKRKNNLSLKQEISL